jgi:hypothetical protein
MHRSIWFSRFVLGAAALLMTGISIKYMTDPVGAVAPQGIVLRTAEAITIMRVSGGLFLGIALTLVGCLLAERRLLVGLGFLATIATTILALRLVGLVVDGPGPFTLFVLKPEVALVVLSSLAFVIERRRQEA